MLIMQTIFGYLLSLSSPMVLKISILIAAFIINIADAADRSSSSLSKSRPPQSWQPSATQKPPRISCYECYGSLENCATDRRNLIGGPKIKRCGRNEDQCLFRKDPYSDFVALTCSADCVPTAITFCCRSELCNCIGPSGCPAAIPAKTLPPQDEEYPYEIIYKTQPTTSRLFPYVGHYDNYDDRLAVFIDNFPMTQPETTTSNFYFRHAHAPYMQIPAKSLSLENAPELLPTRRPQILAENPPDVPTRFPQILETTADLTSARHPESRVHNEIIMSAAADVINSTVYRGLHCWQCHGKPSDCQMTSYQAEKTSAQIKACAPAETYCSIVEFGDIERTVEMECTAKCTPQSMKHLKVKCCTTSLCNCIADGGETDEDCRLLTASYSFMQGAGMHPTTPSPPAGYTYPTRPIWFFQIDAKSTSPKATETAVANIQTTWFETATNPRPPTTWFEIATKPSPLTTWSESGEIKQPATPAPSAEIRTTPRPPTTWYETATYPRPPTTWFESETAIPGPLTTWLEKETRLPITIQPWFQTAANFRPLTTLSETSLSPQTTWFETEINSATSEQWVETATNPGHGIATDLRPQTTWSETETKPVTSEPWLETDTRPPTTWQETQTRPMFETTTIPRPQTTSSETETKPSPLTTWFETATNPDIYIEPNIQQTNLFETATEPITYMPQTTASSEDTSTVNTIEMFTTSNTLNSSMQELQNESTTDSGYAILITQENNYDNNDDIDEAVLSPTTNRPTTSTLSIDPGPFHESAEILAAVKSTGINNCYFCYNCPLIIPPIDPATQAIECPEDKRVACVKAEANFVTLNRIDRYCSDICPTDTDMVKYHCCDRDFCNRSNHITQSAFISAIFAILTASIVRLRECSDFF